MIPPFRPLGDRVLIRPEASPTQTESGILLAEDWKPEQTGTVIALGTAINAKQDTQLHQMAVGDYVVFSWQAGQELWINDGQDRLLILKAVDVLAVVEGVSA